MGDRVFEGHECPGSFGLVPHGVVGEGSRRREVGPLQSVVDRLVFGLRIAHGNGGAEQLGYTLPVSFRGRDRSDSDQTFGCATNERVTPAQSQPVLEGLRAAMTSPVRRWARPRLP